LVAVLGAHAAEKPPMMEILVNDGARLLQRWDASLYAKLWNDRVMEATRAKVAEQLAVAEAELGMSVRDFLGALNSFDARIDSFPTPEEGKKPEPLFSLQADLGPIAARMLPLILSKDPDGSEAANVPGADEALRPKNREGKPTENLLLARYGNRLVGSNHAQQPAPWLVKPTEADLTITMDYRSFMWMAAEQSKADPQQQAVFDAFLNNKDLDAFLAPLTWEMTVVPEGVRERISQDVVYPGVKPADRTLFNRLPENTLMALAIGYDTKSYWTILEPMLLDVIAAQQPGLTRDQIIKGIEDQLTNLGLQLTYPDLVQAIDGTVMLAITPGAPFPAVTLVVPRSKAVDSGLRFAAAMQQWEIPADGASAPLTIPNVPLPVNLIADKGYWVVSTDPTLPTTWFAGGKGWSGSPAMTLAFEKAGADAAMIGASDTNAVLRTAGGFLALIPFPDAKDKQTATVLLARASAAAGTGYVVGQQRGKTWELEARGVLGFGAVPAIIAAIAIPNLLESRNKANEVGVVSLLRSGVFPAQIQFQAGAYLDQDGDNVGEFGFFSEMAGGPISGQPDTLKLALLPEVWDAAQPLVHGYRFSCWLPDGKGGALGGGDGLRPQNAAAAKAQSQRFVVYAWSPGDASKPVYALTQTGTIYAKTGITIGADGPVWHALFGEDGWEADPQWEPYRKR
jgi:hypothetical protein